MIAIPLRVQNIMWKGKARIFHCTDLHLAGTFTNTEHESLYAIFTWRTGNKMEERKNDAKKTKSWRLFFGFRGDVLKWEAEDLQRYVHLQQLYKMFTLYAMEKEVFITYSNVFFFPRNSLTTISSCTDIKLGQWFRNMNLFFLSVASCRFLSADAIHIYAKQKWNVWNPFLSSFCSKTLVFEWYQIVRKEGALNSKKMKKNGACLHCLRSPNEISKIYPELLGLR